MTLIQNYINQADALDLDSLRPEIEDHSNDNEFNAILRYSLADDDTLEIEVTGTQTTEQIAKEDYATIVTDYAIYKISVFNGDADLVCELPLSQMTQNIYKVMNREFDVHLENVDYGTDQYHKWGYNFVA